jgi:hypothetical protein
MVEINDDEPIVRVAPPWKLKGTVYILSFWNGKTFAAEGKGSDKSQKEAGPPTIAYSPLEAKSSFADPSASGEYLGGISQIQILRYTESPVGPYDELIVCPGFFAYEKEDDKGKKKKMKNVRITRIYVSQKHTCWNGRNSELTFAPTSSTRLVFRSRVGGSENQGTVSSSSLLSFASFILTLTQTGISPNTLRALNGKNCRVARRA